VHAIKVAVENRFGNIVKDNNATVVTLDATSPGSFTSDSTRA
jgi:hypothetical protein